jgi:ornithine carbamoyltransferase
MYELGGRAVYLGPDDVGLGVRESIVDVARTVSRFVHGVALRVFSHDTLVKFSDHSTIPVLNALSDRFHPCQILSDIFTIREKLGRLRGVKISFVGDGNNVCHSWLIGGGKMGLRVTVATPKTCQPDTQVVKIAKELSEKSGGKIEILNDPKEACRGAEVIYTDTWVSMGEEVNKEKKIKAFSGFQVNHDLIALAKKEVLIMHCLPAHRGEEVAPGILESPSSVIFDQAENRLHVAKAILIKLLLGDLK